MRETLRRETKALHIDGRWFSVVADPIFNENSNLTGWVHVMSDTTEQKKLEVQFQQAQKMESVGQLAGGVLHDYNNMLSIILCFSGLAVSRVDPADPLHDDLQEVIKAAQRATVLTRQLLMFARKQTVAPIVLDLNTAIDGMLKMVQRLIGEDIALSWTPKANLWPVKLDPSQLSWSIVVYLPEME